MVEIIGSKEKALNRFGQNGFSGPSSDTPGKHTTSGFLPKAKAPAAHPSLAERVKLDGHGQPVEITPRIGMHANEGSPSGKIGDPAARPVTARK